MLPFRRQIRLTTVHRLLTFRRVPIASPQCVGSYLSPHHCRIQAAAELGGSAGAGACRIHRPKGSPSKGT
ncbi:hypothetical protein U9M48_007944 [Paspalum notatum var. saurae]|uniref:Uncharacterized protein n=1 Tax=Paspalum notatum var. saurae TaxID=547442 RepID=A0AAQ3SN22_PASNO